MAERGETAAPTPSRSWVARIAAALALAAAIAAIVLIVSGSLGDDEGSSESAGNGGGKEARADDETSTKETVPEETDEELPETYEVQSGDSLSTIAEEYGISVERLERLNPEVDPAALATGQTLKLR